ncbi:6-hydroxynicotinate 3-monooxygenase [Madurella mycetomatis]|uniref:6-hydroxynicotinate 3-monooxygenase n=1 Tax=Madurella mycetomatis TaxID=100816 RepID=A0A175VPH6_9PEZI|nr:6-hydroxynicotinate 3-monooxygenase [Madurella mycetomatis]KXX80011.1 6-hydroxynicotinate 3-monooxygenase [Madurella mycetomatis]
MVFIRQHNISYSLVDRETAPRDRNWGITLSWALPLLESLLPPDLVSQLQACQPDTSLSVSSAGEQGVLIRDGATGAIKIRVLYPDGVRRMQIQKTKRVLSSGLRLQYGKRLVSLSYDSQDQVTAHFADGTSETGSIVVGADGGSSQVRRCLLGEAAAAQEVLPYAFMNFPFSLPAEKARWLDGVMNPSVDVAPHPKGMYMGLFLLDKPDLERPETWVFYVLVTWPIATKEDEENTDNRLERLRAHMDDWADPYKSVVEWLADDVAIGRDQLRIWHPKEWDNKGGRATLAGDAAHSMTFHRGQGGNLAIKDADEFVKRMVDVHEGKLSLKVAVDDYEKGVLARGQEVEISKQQAMAFHDYENFDNSPVFKMGIKPSGS